MAQWEGCCYVLRRDLLAKRAADKHAVLWLKLAWEGEQRQMCRASPQEAEVQLLPVIACLGAMISLLSYHNFHSWLAGVINNAGVSCCLHLLWSLRPSHALKFCWAHLAQNLWGLHPPGYGQVKSSVQCLLATMQF